MTLFERILQKHYEEYAAREARRLDEEGRLFIKMGFAPEELIILAHSPMSGQQSHVCPKLMLEEEGL